jgi:hypothetical protein
MSNQQSCVCRCSTLVPPELVSVSRCVFHFTLSAEQACAEIHREIVLRRVDAERQASVASYISECALLLARVTSSNLRLSDEQKRRILSSFLCLMNLRETLARVSNLHLSDQHSPGLAMAGGTAPFVSVLPVGS